MTTETDPTSSSAGTGQVPTRVLVAPVADGILRIGLTSGDDLPAESSLVRPEFVAVDCRDLLPSTTANEASFVVRRGGPGEALLEVSHGSSQVPLLRLGSASLQAVDLVRYDTAGAAPILTSVKTVDGQRTFIQNLVEQRVGSTFAAEVALRPLPGEGLYGLGQDEAGGYQRRGTKVYLYQHNMRIPMPCLISDHGYGLLFDCGSLMNFDGTGEEALIRLEAVPAIDCYLVVGGVADIVRGFRRLTGAAPMLPKWAFGYLQSKERYHTSDELLEVARRHRASGIPLDALVQDWKTWIGDDWGQKTVDPERFGDLPALKTELHQLGVHSMVSVWPNMATGCADHQEFAEAGLLLNDYSTYDAFDPAARELYWRQLRAELFGGFDSWWCDSTEPFSAPDWQGQTLLPERERYELVGREHERYLGAERANLYALEHAKGIYQHELAEQATGAPVRRVLNLTRSGYPGIQQYGAVLWSGDVSATWDELRAEVAKAITMGLCGVPWWTTDAGAFFTGGTASWRRWSGDPDAPPVWFWRGDYDDGVANAGYRELYCRWLQFAALLPMFRSHGTDTPREVWQFGEPGSRCYEAIADTIRLRYRLLPYIYTVAAQAALQDSVMVRGLLFDFADDPLARGVSDEFLLGEALLVCPVLQAVYYDRSGAELPQQTAPARECYLPEGCDWWDFWSGERHAGGQWITAPAPLERSPMFVRAGSVVALQAPVSHALENRDRFEVVIYPGADGGGELYDDDGLTHNYQDGDFSRLEFSWDDSARRLDVIAANWSRARPFELNFNLGESSRKLTFTGTASSISFKEDR